MTLSKRLDLAMMARGFRNGTLSRTADVPENHLLNGS
jgi:hypothetical protein